MASIWEQRVKRRATGVQLPRLDEVVLPRPQVVGPLLDAQVCWLVGPPKVGKTLLAHLLAYLDLVRTPQRDGDLMFFDGAVNCSRGLDLLLEGGPDADPEVVIFDDPFRDDGAAPNETFVSRLQRFASRREVRVIVTSRLGGFVSATQTLPQGWAQTPLRSSEWYDRDELLARFTDEIPGISLALIEELEVPARLIDKRDFDIWATEAERGALRGRYGDTSDVVLDKLQALESDHRLAIVAMLLRLQEYAFSLPTTDELSSLIAGPVESVDKLGIVAVTFDFEDESRLRFEHATAREAAQRLLERDRRDGYARLLAVLRNRSTHWIHRALSLWEAEQLAADSAWPELQQKDETTLAAMAARIVRASDGDPASFALVGALPLDAWSAQDLSYEIAAGWDRYAEIPAAQQLVQQLIDDTDSGGLYAVFEALLYNRPTSEKTDSLWSRTQMALDTLVDRGRPWNRTLLLALDALAWRFPPDVHAELEWAKRFLSALEIDDPELAVVRFLRCYHPDGLAALADRLDLGPKIELDLTREWSTRQAKLGCWLTEWHFVHQCRARAQLAHQPWLPLPFLGRSSHPDAASSDRDLTVARTVNSLAGRHPGWAYFLAQNLRSVEPASHGPATVDAATTALTSAPPTDIGVVASVLTYGVHPTHRERVRSHFSDPSAADVLFDGLVNGLLVDKTRLNEPRFSFRRPVHEIYAATGQEWPEIVARLPPGEALVDGRFNFEGIVSGLERALREHAAVLVDREIQELGEAVLERAHSGDLRPVEIGAPHRARPAAEGPPDPYHLLLESAVAYMTNEGGAHG